MRKQLGILFLQFSFFLSSPKRVLNSGLDMKFARPAILTQANWLPTSTESFADGLDMRLEILSRDRRLRNHLHQDLLQKQRFIQPAAHELPIATQQEVHSPD